MGKRKKRPCSRPRCPNLVDFPNRLCRKHRRKVWRQRAKEYVASNPKEWAFYNSKIWLAERKEHLLENPFCVVCGTFAEMVDHIIPIRIDWERRLDRTNFQSMCHACHHKKRGREAHIYGKDDRDRS